MVYARKNFTQLIVKGFEALRHVLFNFFLCSLYAFENRRKKNSDSDSLSVAATSFSSLTPHPSTRFLFWSQVSFSLFQFCRIYERHFLCFVYKFNFKSQPLISCIRFIPGWRNFWCICSFLNAPVKNLIGWLSF